MILVAYSGFTLKGPHPFCAGAHRAAHSTPGEVSEEWSRGQESPALICHNSFTILKGVMLVIVIPACSYEDIPDIFVLVANMHSVSLLFITFSLQDGD